MAEADKNLSLLFHPEFPKERSRLKGIVTQYLGIPPPAILPPKAFSSDDSLGEQLLYDISRFELLTAEQESAIAEMLNESRAQIASILEYYDNDLSRLCTDESATERLNYYTNLSETLEHILVERNVRLIIPFIKDKNRWNRIEHLFSAAVLGLYRAAQKYNGETRFSTYAATWIRNKAQLEREAGDTPVKMSSSKIKEVILLKKRAEARFIHEHGHYPSYTQLAKAILDLFVEIDTEKNIEITEYYLNKKRKWIRILLSRISMNTDILSLDEHVGGEDSDYRTRYDLNSDSSADMEPTIENSERTRLIERLEECLTGREVAILRMKYDLFDANLGREYKDGEIAALWSRFHERGITRQRISQIHQEIMEKLKRPDRAIVLKEYIQFVRNNRPIPIDKRKR